MEKVRIVLNQAFVSSLFVVGTVVLSAIAFNYSGNIQLKIAADGIQVIVAGPGKNP